MKYKITLTIGLGFDRENKPRTVAQNIEAAAVFEGRLCNTYGGFTKHFGQGGWQDRKLGIVMEEVAVYSVVVSFRTKAEVKKAAAGMAATARRLFFQACIPYEIAPVNVVFYAGETL